MEDNEITIPQYSPSDVLMAQAMFGQLVSTQPDILRLINTFGPMLFAGVLFSLCEDYRIDPNDADNITPARSNLEAENAAIGVIRGVARAMSQDSLDTLDEEVDTDTGIEPIQPD